MGDENRRLQALENDKKKDGPRIDILEANIQEIKVSVAAIGGHLAQLGSAVPPRWKKAEIIATTSASVIAVTLGIFSICQTFTSQKSLQGQLTRAQADIQMLSATLAPQLLTRIGEVVTASISMPNKDVGGSLSGALNIVDHFREARSRSKTRT